MKGQFNKYFELIEDDLSLLMTPEQVKEKFEREGRTFTSWAKEKGFDPGVVLRVVNGTNKGRYGEAHRVAVALGIKEAA